MLATASKRSRHKGYGTIGNERKPKEELIEVKDLLKEACCT